MIDQGQCNAGEAYALRIIGDDMAPEFIEGHIIIVDPGGRLSSGCFVVARQGESVILRQLQIVDGEFRLRALKNGLPEIVLGNGSGDIAGVVSQRSGTRRSAHKHYAV